MSLTKYNCPSCGEGLKLHLWMDTCKCPECHAVVELTPHYMQSRWFSLFVLIFSILLGHVLGIARMMDRRDFDVIHLALDLGVYFFVYWILRVVLFRFQSPIVNQNEGF